MPLVQVEVEEGSYLWAEIMLRQGKKVTHKELGDDPDNFYYLTWNERCTYPIRLWGWSEGESYEIDYRIRGDLPNSGYELFDLTKLRIDQIEEEMHQLQIQINLLVAKREALYNESK